MRCEHLHDSAVYVLGALSPPEREAYERHLVDCAECRAEVAEFADVPALLGRLDRASAEAIAAADDSTDDAVDNPAGDTANDGAAAPSGWAGPSIAATGPSWAGPIMSAAHGPVPGKDASAGEGPNTVENADGSSAGRGLSPAVGGAGSSTGRELGTVGLGAGTASTDAKINGHAVDPLLPRVLDRVQHKRRGERRRRRWQTAGTAFVAACLGVLAVLGVRAAGVGQPAAPEFVAMREVAGPVPVTAKLALEPIADGTLVRMQCAYKEGNEAGYGKWLYKLVVVPKSGNAEELNSWTAGYGDEYDLKAHSHIPRSDIQRVEIRKSDGTALLVLTA